MFSSPLRTNHKFVHTSRDIQARDRERFLSGLGWLATYQFQASRYLIKRKESYFHLPRSPKAPAVLVSWTNPLSVYYESVCELAHKEHLEAPAGKWHVVYSETFGNHLHIILCHTVCIGGVVFHSQELERRLQHVSLGSDASETVASVTSMLQEGCQCMMHMQMKDKPKDQLYDLIIHLVSYTSGGCMLGILWIWGLHNLPVLVEEGWLHFYTSGDRIKVQTHL